MANKRLSEKDIKELLGQYRSERRRLNFQLEKVRTSIKELKALMGDGDPDADDEIPASKGPHRPQKARKTTRVPKKPGRRKKRTVVGGYRLSEWDQLVLDAIRKSGKLLPKEDIMRTATAWARKHEPSLNEGEIEAKITRVLQKLSGKRGELGAHQSGLRRGYHYGLKEWFFASSGKLRKQHYDKLVLTKD